MPSAEWEVKAGLSMRGPGGRSGPARLVLARFWRRNAAADPAGAQASAVERRRSPCHASCTTGELSSTTTLRLSRGARRCTSRSIGRLTPSPSIPR